MLNYINIFNNKFIFYYLITNIIIIRLSKNNIFNSVLLIFIYIIISINIFSKKKIKKKYTNKKKNIRKKILKIKKNIYFLKNNFPNIYDDLIRILDNYFKIYKDIKYLKKKKLFDKNMKTYYDNHINNINKHTVQTFSNIKFTDYNKYIEIEKDIKKIIYKILNIF